MRKRSLACNTDETICAISTPVGEGGIGIVRLSGKKALFIADKVFLSKDKGKPSTYKTYTTHYGHIIRRASSVLRCAKKKSQLTQYAIRLPRRQAGNTQYATIDEVILTVMKAPKSYTKEDVVEINCHGGVVALRKVLDLVLSLGARMAGPGEFTKRAFLNGRIDLAQAEAVLDVIRSKTESSMKAAVSELEGELSKEIRRLKSSLLDIIGQVEARIDFSEEDIELASTEHLIKKLTAISKEMKRLISESWKGKVLKEGIMCVICGKPNAGKSSLMNAFLKRNRVIVTPVPGTTRDAIEEEISLEGIPIRIVDTAGISAAKGVVERHGIRKSRSYIKKADLILFMLDFGSKWSEKDRNIFDSIKRKNFIIVANKSDLKNKLDMKKVKKITKNQNIIEISLLKRKNIDGLENAILKKIWHGEIPHPEGAFITNLRHKKDLEQALESVNKACGTLKKAAQHPEIVASSLNEAVFFLGSILGDTVEPDILDKIFSKFCIGK